MATTDQILAQMAANSNAWKTADAATRTSLANANLALGQQLSANGVTATRTANGAWNVLEYNNGVTSAPKTTVPTTPVTQPTQTYTPTPAPTYTPTVQSTPTYTPAPAYTPPATPKPAVTPTAAPVQQTTSAPPPTGNTTADQILARMAQNSNEWRTASADRRKQLEAENVQMGTQLNSLGFNATRDANGKWSVLSYSGGQTPATTTQPAAQPTGGLTAVAPKTGNTQADAILNQMVQNSAAWNSATPEVKQQLADANLRLGENLKAMGIEATRDANGVWNVLNYTGANGQQKTGSLQGQQQVQVPLTGQVIDFELDPITPPEQYMAMNPQDVYNAIMSSSGNVGRIFDTVAELAKSAIAAGDIDITAAIKVYTDKIEASLNATQAKFDEMYADGTNDPGLKAALQLMREGAAEQREIMLEELNARGLSRSGLLVKAEERFIKGAASQEAQLIGQFMSQLYQTYMGSMQNILNQRVGYLTQMGQLAGEAAIQSSKNKVDAISAAMQSMTDIGNTMAAMHTSAWDTAFDAYGTAMNYNETARHNYTTEQEQRRSSLAAEGIQMQELYGAQNQNFLNYSEAVRSNKAGERQYDLKLSQDFTVALQQLGLQDAELQERIRSNKASEGLSYAQLQLTAQKYRADAANESARLQNDAVRLGLEKDKMAMEERLTNFQISDAGVRNSLTRMELDLAASRQANEDWQINREKAETMAVHLAATQGTLQAFVEKARSGQTPIETAMREFEVTYAAMGTTPGLHNVGAELSYYRDAKAELDKIISTRANIDANTKQAWTRFSQGLDSLSWGALGAAGQNAANQSGWTGNSLNQLWTPTW